MINFYLLIIIINQVYWWLISLALYIVHISMFINGDGGNNKNASSI
jgi:hypothetical protein